MDDDGAPSSIHKSPTDTVAAPLPSELEKGTKAPSEGVVDLQRVKTRVSENGDAEKSGSFFEE